MLLLLSGKAPTRVNWWTSTAEQTLFQNLMTESIKFHGLDVTYMPRDLRREDVLYNEDIRSHFTRTYKIKAYVKNTAGWDGQGDFLSKFGVQIKDSLSLHISRETFADVFGDSEITRPREGDLVYLPAPLDSLFEVKFVAHEKAQNQFYPIGALTYYELRLETYTNNQENFATGNTSLDIFETDTAYAQNLYLPTGSGDYTVGETAFQGPNLVLATATGIVGSWNVNTSILKVTSLTGSFANAVPVIGATSGASYTLGETPNALTLPNDPIADNDYLKTQGDDIVAEDR